MGDLIATCISPQSRNRFFGEQLGKGRTVNEVAAEMDQVAEGVKTAPVVCTLADEAGVVMPIASEINLVVRGQQSAHDAYRGLLGRQVRRESDEPLPHD